MNFAPSKLHFVRILSFKIEASIRQIFVDSVCQSRPFVLYVIPNINGIHNWRGYNLWKIEDIPVNFAPSKLHYVSILSPKIEASIRRIFVDSVCQSMPFVLCPNNRPTSSNYNIWSLLMFFKNRNNFTFVYIKIHIYPSISTIHCMLKNYIQWHNFMMVFCDGENFKCLYLRTSRSWVTLVVL